MIDPLLNWLLDGLGDLISPILSSAVTLLVEQLVDMLALNLDLPLPQLPGAAAAVTLHLSLQPSSVLMEPDGGKLRPGRRLDGRQVRRSGPARLHSPGRLHG